MISGAYTSSEKAGRLFFKRTAVLQSVKEPLLSCGESGGSLAIWGKISEYQLENGAPPAPLGQLFQIHGNIFKPDPSGNGGQASVVCM